MIHPNVIVYQSRPSPLKNNRASMVYNLPATEILKDWDYGIIDFIRNQPKPNDISKYTTSPYAEDIKQIVKLIGSYCKTNSINEVFNVIKDIHETLNDKEAPVIKNWIRFLTGIHPDLDTKLKTLGYWKMPYSEVIGTNTITYYANMDSIDITEWGTAPKFLDNRIKWFTEPWPSPQYIRESIRQKLNTPVVEMIQNANHITTKYLRRNLIFESIITTKSGTGDEVVQERPVKPEIPTINHGLSLNNDWYHQTYRIMPPEIGNKILAYIDAVEHLMSGGYYVYKLVNHLTPLLNMSISNFTATRMETPLGIEDTFPNGTNRTKGTVDVDNSNQIVHENANDINNDVLKPEIIQGE